MASFFTRSFVFARAAKGRLACATSPIVASTALFSCACFGILDDEAGFPIEKKTVRVAVIGTGIAGSSCSYFLNELQSRREQDVDIHVDVFERASAAGGRVRSCCIDQDVHGEDVIGEVGAGIMIDENKFNVSKLPSSLHLSP